MIWRNLKASLVSWLWFLGIVAAVTLTLRLMWFIVTFIWEMPNMLVEAARWLSR